MSTFQQGATYKFSGMFLALMKAVMGVEFKGEEGVFTVAEVNEDGTVFTDDITSPITQERCKIPAHIVDDVELVALAETGQHCGECQCCSHAKGDA